VTGDDLLLLPSEGGGMLACLGLIQGLACNNHGGNESLLLSVCGSGGDLSCSRDVILFPLSGGGGGGLLLIDREVAGAARHGQQDDGG
jgi:hypothetical protein